MEDCCVIVRSIGERTTAWCIDRASIIFDSDNIIVVDERPQHDAIAKVYEVSIEHNREWTIVIDADVLLRKEGILKLLEKAKSLPSDSFCHYGMVFDKLSNSFRSAGHNIFRTEHMRMAVQFLPSIKTEIRPDTFIRKSMAKLGFHYYRDLVLVGLHDFEQSFFDLYRKGFLQGVKNRTKVDRFISQWPQNWKSDLDYQVIKGGIEDGLLYQNQLVLDPDFFLVKFETWRRKSLLMNEKENLTNELEHIQDFMQMTMSDTMIEDFKKQVLSRKYHYHNRSNGGVGYKFMKFVDGVQEKLNKAKFQ
jgi:hypothetical protein